MSNTFTFDGVTYSKSALTKEAQADLDEARHWLALARTPEQNLWTRNGREDALARFTVSAYRNISIRNSVDPTPLTRKLDDQICDLLREVVQYALDRDAQRIIEILKENRLTISATEIAVAAIRGQLPF